MKNRTKYNTLVGGILTFIRINFKENLISHIASY
jgi:hypothetical protein